MSEQAMQEGTREAMTAELEELHPQVKHKNGRWRKDADPDKKARYEELLKMAADQDEQTEKPPTDSNEPQASYNFSDGAIQEALADIEDLRQYVEQLRDKYPTCQQFELCALKLYEAGQLIGNGIQQAINESRR